MGADLTLEPFTFALDKLSDQDPTTHGSTDLVLVRLPVHGLPWIALSARRIALRNS
jgi:hypothetical protein